MTNQVFKPKSKNPTEPSLLKVIFYATKTNFVSPNTKNVRAPKMIKGYRLSSEIKKEGELRNFTLGIYQKGNRKFFIKSWCQEKKNLSYYTLLNEFCSSKIISKKLKEIGNKVRVPEAIEFIDEGSRISAVYEYVNGESISKLPLKNQLEYQYQVLIALKKASKKITPDEKKLFSKRSPIFYFLSLPLLTLIAAFRNKKHRKKLLKAYVKTLFLFRRSKKLYLAHRDIHTENIKLNGNIIYLLDCEDLVLTIPGFDIADFNILLSSLNTKDKDSIKSKFPRYKFLENYISIHRSGNSLHDDRYKNYLFETK